VGPRIRATVRCAGVVEEIELYELIRDEYELVARYHSGQEFRPAIFPEINVRVGKLFDTQMKQFAERKVARQKRPGGEHDESDAGRDERQADQSEPPTRNGETEPEPVPRWLVPRDTQLGLAYLIVLGHPKRRFEIWDNRAPCVLAFGSDEEARFRFTHFLEDICRWERSCLPRATSMAPGVDVAEVGRFNLTRRGSHVWLDVAVDARKYRRMLEVSTRRDSWDWGDRDRVVRDVDEET
jgi:hypothetical protein